VANAMSDIFQDGVAWIDLSSLADSTLLTPTIAKIFSVHELPSQSLSETLANNLRSKQLLLILDNCEHLVEACAKLAELLLRACPLLQVLTTRREVLSLTGELIFQVPTLALPDQQAVKLPEALMQYAGIQLFVDRARLVKPDFALNQLTAPMVIQVCQRLDGIPLAIELAAARLNILSVEQIALRLGDRFDLLTAGNRTALPHQQTLRAALDWSYDLLDAEERLLFQRLAVFAGGFNLDAAETVCTGAPLNPLDILNLMGHLVDKSLVIVEPQADARHEQTRCRMLETIREYAREKLEASGESQMIRDRHLEFFLQMAEGSESEFYSSQQLFWLGRWEEEIDNLRAALTWSAARVGAPDSEKYTEAGLRLGGAGAWFWDRGYRREHLERLNEMLAASTRATLGRGKALAMIGFLRWAMNDFANARLPLKEAITITRKLGDNLTLIWSLGHLGAVEIALGDQAEAQLHFEEGLALRHNMVGAGRNAVGWILSFLGDIPFAQGNYQRAQMLFEESAEIIRETRDRNFLTLPLRRLGFVAVKQGEFSRAADFFKESLTCNQEVGHSEGIIRCIAAFASLGAAQGKFIQAVQLCGAVAGLLDSMSARLFFSDKIEYELNVSRLRAQLDEETFAKFWAKGAALTLEQAVAFALETRGELKE
ncbi:MAG TPA: tetratricopeptide repeat protein, partial [Anaerolineae bacterium]|nr:tetratricopeptide repeat protein [Anaerolineae bacterium]